MTTSKEDRMVQWIGAGLVAFIVLCVLLSVLYAG
jgi:hypothetical protein